MFSSSDENDTGAPTQRSDPVSTFGYFHGEQKDWLHEREGMSLAALSREHEKPDLGLSSPVDVYPMHKHFYFPAENIYFLVGACCISPHYVLIGKI